MSWRFYLEDRDGELVPQVRYENPETIYDTKDEYEMARECAQAGHVKEGKDGE